MVQHDYLIHGVNGLANAHLAGTMAGHLGAAVAAGYFWGEDQSDLPDEVFRGVEGELDRVMAGEEAIWFNAKQAGVTPEQLFNPLPKEEPQPDSISKIAKALAGNVSKTRQSGHNVIFASIALRALHDHPDLATPSVISGVCQLTEGFNTTHAGRGYYGQEKGWLTGNQVQLTEADNFPTYGNLQDMVNATIGALIEKAAVKKQGFGGLFHLINHAAGITELNRFGYKQLANSALPAHHQHLRLWRSLPDVESELGKVEKSDLDPRTPEYWQGMFHRDQARLTHRIKTLYGYYTLRRLMEDEAKQKQADDAFLYLMA
ncbi:hypothetical protein GC197_03060 [bacterium]|nr:hypothetical protein [bacterium]